MPTCPLCRKELAELVAQCPRCKADLSLLKDYVQQQQDGLAKADALARSGELGEAVWAYLELLEADPDNAAARKQVSRVAAAVRQFDRAAHRGWLARRRGQAQFSQAPPWYARPWFLGAVAAALAAAGFALGYGLGYRDGLRQPPTGEVTAHP